MSSQKSWIFLLMALLSLIAAVIGCEKTPMDVLIPNQPPQVALSSGPIRDSTNVFIATFNWNASDSDGQVVMFRYAIDDTMEADDWFETDDFELTLFFTAPDSSRIDSIYIGAATVPLERYVFNGAHTFFLKAIDNYGAESAPAARSFTAETMAPETQITNPNPGGVVNLGPTFTITWDGNDPDGTEEPVAYSWRRVQVDNVVNMTDEQIEQALLHPNPEVLPGVVGGDPWSPMEPRTSVQMTDLPVPGQFVFGVRALDQAGAIEPRMRTFRAPGTTNVLLIRAEEEGGLPRLEVSSAVKTTQFPTGDVRKKTFQIPANTDVLFTWTADASFYGGNIAGYSYGVDLIDLEETNPGWAPESANLIQARLHFSIPEGSPTEEHLLFVRARDDVGTSIIADISLIVVPLRFERDIIYIDDWGKDDRGRAYVDVDDPHCISRDGQTSTGEPGLIDPDKVIPSGDIPHDMCHDHYLRDAVEQALADLGHPEWVVDRYEPLDPVDGSTLFGTVDIDSTTNDYWTLTGPITLDELARYKMVFWNTRSFPTNALKAMNTEGEDNFLAVYLEAGGAVWLNGTGVFVRTLFGAPPGLSPFGFRPEDFPFRFLHVQSMYVGADCENGCFRQSGDTSRYQRENGFEAAVLYNNEVDGATDWSHEGWPDSIWVGREPFHQNAIKGIKSCDAMVVPLGIDMNPSLRVFGGRLDSLYKYRSNWRVEVFPPGTSWMDDGATALRYSGPAQGRLMMFGFPFFYFTEDQLNSLLVPGLRWLLEE
jgi:hypothetical protein